ncbi:MAG TPA: 2-(1,2-epoxy-1,2-dihydrophenyl)acetyl-CoA isomerase PaaG [Caulobacteraceae bacterium]|nr:2-(1,2-epoxy-1,2-dihydrophenyl)acetyl-CoA isomerase PaaG [Caulobacteraceae bacterium]
MTFDSIRLDLAGGVARLTLDRPDRLNSFTAAMHREVVLALDQVVAEGARVLVLTGAGRGFCAGQDLSDPAIAAGGDLGATLEENYNPLIRRLAALPMPVIAAVNGVAAGAGANIALACDIVLAARSARFIQSFANIGLVPDSGGTWVLPRLVGQARALGLALTGQPLTAEQAEAWGLIWRCVEDDQLGPETDALAGKFATAPTAGLAAAKRLIRAHAAAGLDDALDGERDAQAALGRSADYAEGVEAFAAKRPPHFVGR